MFITLLAAPFLIALAASHLGMRLFCTPIQTILGRVVSVEISGTGTAT